MVILYLRDGTIRVLWFDEILADTELVRVYLPPKGDGIRQNQSFNSVDLREVRIYQAGQRVETWKMEAGK